MSIHCPECNAEIQPGAKFCGKCGEKVAAVAVQAACTQCSAPWNPGKFCKICGHKYGEEASIKASEPVALPVEQPAPVVVSVESVTPVTPVPEPVVAAKPPAPEPAPVALQEILPLPECEPISRPEPDHLAVESAKKLPEPLPFRNGGKKVVFGGAVLLVAALAGGGYWFMKNSSAMPEATISASEPVPNIVDAVKTEPPPTTEPVPTTLGNVEPVPEAPSPAPVATPQPPARPKASKPKEVVHPKPAALPQSAPQSQLEPLPEAKKPQAVTSDFSCKDLPFMLVLTCKVEGKEVIRKCAPDLKRWDNSIPGCQRGSASSNEGSLY